MPSTPGRPAGSPAPSRNARSPPLRRTIRNPPFPQHTSPESTKAAGPRGSGAVVHDPVVGTAGSCGAGAGAVAGEHLRGTPAVQRHQVSFRAAAVQPGVAEMVPKAVRVHLHAAFPAAPLDHLVDPAGGRKVRHMEEGYTQLGTVLTDQRPQDSEGDGVIVVGRFKGDPYDGVQLSYDAGRRK